MLNHRTIRRNIRKAWSRGDSNPRNRGAWSNPAAEFRLSSDPLDFRESYWRFFGARYDSITLTIAETYEELKTYTLTYKNPLTPDYTRTQERPDDTYDFTATVTRPNIKPYGIDNPFTTPPQARIQHVSATPYGEGLYECRGSVRVNGDTHYVSNPTDTEPPPPPAEDITDTAVIDLVYQSDATAIDGRMTPCMVVAGQYFSGPLVMFQPIVVGPEQPFLPYPADEYGVTNPDGSSVEKYYWPTVLDNLLSGTLMDTTVRNSGALTDGATFPDPLDPIDTYSASHNWSRTGTFTLTIS